MNNKWQKGIKDLQDTHLTLEEKSRLLQNVLMHSSYMPVKNHLIFNSLITIRRHANVLFFLVVMMGVGVVFFSEKSLPGNVLYPVKIKITEPVRDLIKVAPKEKIEWQAEKATRRLEEAEILLAQDELDDKKRDEIENLFNKYTESFRESSEKEIQKIGFKNKKERVVNTEINKEWSTNKGQEDKIATTTGKIEKRKESREKARDEMEKRLEKLEKAKDKTFKRANKEESKEVRGERASRD